MVTLKSKIATFLKGKTFENSKSALWDFEKATNEKASIIYFSRVFAQHKLDVKKTKKEKVADFIVAGKYKTCELAHTAYTATGEDVSLIYFSRVYTAVRKETGVSKKSKVSVITLTGLTAKQIVLVVKEKAGVAVKGDLKNKKAIATNAMKILTNKGFKVNN